MKKVTYMHSESEKLLCSKCLHEHFKVIYSENFCECGAC